MRIRIPTLVALAAAVAVLTPVPAAAQAQDQELLTTLSGIEKSLWKGWAEHDTAPFERSLADPAVNVGADGISSGKADVLEFIAGHSCEVGDYSFSDWSVHRVTEDVAVLTYRATQDGVCGGEMLAPVVNVATVYVRKGGSWMNAVYAEAPAASEMSEGM